MSDQAIRIGDRVRVTKTEYTKAAPVGTTGVVTRIGKEDDGRPVISIKRDDGEGIGWAEQVERI